MQTTHCPQAMFNGCSAVLHRNQSAIAAHLVASHGADAADALQEAAEFLVNRAR